MFPLYTLRFALVIVKELDRFLWESDHAPGKHIRQFKVVRMTKSLNVFL
jgi:hypothetical protein